MSQHAITGPVLDPWSVSPKVIAGTLGSLIATFAVAILGYLLTSDGRALYASWPPVAVVALAAVIPGAITFLSGYLKSDAVVRNLSQLSPKVAVQTLISVLVPGALAALGYLQTPDGQTVFAALPPVLTAGVAAVIVALTAYLGGYQKSDPARDQVPVAEVEPLEGEPIDEGEER